MSVPDPIPASDIVSGSGEAVVAADRTDGISARDRTAAPRVLEPTAPDRERQALIRAVLESAPDAIVIIDREGTVLELSPRAQQLFGYSHEQAVGRRLDRLIIPPRLRLRHLEGLAGAVASGARHLERRMELPAVRADGSEFFAEVTVTRLDLDGPPRFAAFIHDITVRRQAKRKLLEHKARLRALASELSLTEERERRRLARGLHDQVGHPLAFAQQRLAELRESRPSGELRSALDDIQEFLRQATAEARSLTFELGSPVLYELGLEAGLESLCRRLAEGNGTRFEFASDPEPKPLSQDSELILYRVVEELLANVVKHARARVARVAVDRVGDEVQIVVEDDGVGIAAAGARRSTGSIGLFSARERLEHLGGRLEIDPDRRSAGRRSGTRPGTRMVAVAPIDGEPPAAGVSR